MFLLLEDYVSMFAGILIVNSHQKKAKQLLHLAQYMI